MDRFFYHPDHIGSSSVITNAQGTVTECMAYMPFGEILASQKNTTYAVPYLFTSKELDSETGLYYFGARYYDPNEGRWWGVDVKTDKHPNLNPFVYCNNNPIKLIDPDGKDWIYSTSVVNGVTKIKLTFTGAIINSSGKSIDVQKLISNETKQFESVFGQGNVEATMLLREIKTTKDLKDHESLIEIKAGDTFNSKDEGGNATRGGKYINLNAAFIDSNGDFIDKKTLMHEIGHTGGLIHPWEFGKSKNTSFLNGNPFIEGVQNFINSSNDVLIDANFMGYSSWAASQPSINPMMSYSEKISYFNETVGKATQGQIQQILDNIFNGFLNSDKDLPK